MDIDVLVAELPYPLEAPSPGVTVDERQRHVEAVRASLADRGLVRGTDVTDGLRDALDLLVSGELVVDGRLALDQPLDLVGVVRGEQAALAVQTGDTIRVSLVDDRALVGMIVNLLPAVRQVTGNSTSIPHEVLTRALTTLTQSGDFFEFERILAQAGVRAPTVRLLAELVRAKGTAAQFGVAFRSPATDTYRQRRVWTWYSGQLGGLLVGLDSAESPVWATLVPADPERVGQYLREGLHALRYGRD